MTKEQRKKYEWYRNIDWEFYEEFPAAGIIILRKNTSSVFNHISWSYLTITKTGAVKEGRHEP